MKLSQAVTTSNLLHTIEKRWKLDYKECEFFLTMEAMGMNKEIRPFLVLYLFHGSLSTSKPSVSSSKKLRTPVPLFHNNICHFLATKIRPSKKHQYFHFNYPPPQKKNIFWVSHNKIWWTLCHSSHNGWSFWLFFWGFPI